jgi:hypothetical protein
VTKPFPLPSQAQGPTGRQAATPDSPVHRRVAVKGSGGVPATVIVVARSGHVWVSITPPFTWEAIMEPGKVDELIHTLGLAREDARQLASTRAAQPQCEGSAVVQGIAGGMAAPASKALGTPRTRP